MAYLTRLDKDGRTRQIGRRGFKKGSYFAHFLKADEAKTVLDSRLEVLAGITADLDPNISNIKAQPFTIDITTGKFFDTKQKLDDHRFESKLRGLKGLYYTPDLQITTKSGTTAVLEIKDIDWLDFSDEYEHKLAAATQIMRSRGINFQILANKFDESFSYVQNLRLLHAINHQINHNDLDPSLLALKSRESDLWSLSQTMHETAEMQCIESIANILKISTTTVCLSIIHGIFRAPIWTEQINIKTRLAGNEFGKPSHVHYFHFDRSQKWII